MIRKESNRIELKIADFCHNCVQFKPVVESIWYGDDVSKFQQRYIICEYNERCNKILNYIRKELEKESKNVW